MKSMTGYGCSEKTRNDGIELKVELRSVNKKQLDVRIGLPSELGECEFEIRKILSTYISRGSVSLKVWMTITGDSLKQSVKINSGLIDFYLNNAKKLAEVHGLQYKFEAKDIYKFPFVVEQVNPDVSRGDIVNDVYDLVKEAAGQFNKNRITEGLFLKNDIEKRLIELEEMLVKIRPEAEKLPRLCKERLMAKIESEGLSLPDNEERLLRELVMFSDRYDVSEEMTRLNSHFSLFRKYICDNGNSCGRSIDFLIQEMAREINTLGVKAAGMNTTALVVAFKTELEKIREQVQNVE